LTGRVRDHLRHNVVGYIALFCFVLGGTAVALPGRNKVDTGDLKKNVVRTSKIAPRAVTAAKIAPRSVDGLRVIDHSLTAQDIDESTLNIRPAPNSIGPTELADRQRRLVFTPSSLVPGVTGTPPKLETVGAFPVLAFANAKGAASLATDVPGSRVEGTKMTVRLLWSSEGSGTVTWDLTYAMVAAGSDVAATQHSEELRSTTTSGELTATTFEIPAGAVVNGDMLGVAVERNGTDIDDTLTDPARLHLVEIDYLATG
jgi:hypothetical protein